MSPPPMDACCHGHASEGFGHAPSRRAKDAGLQTVDASLLYTICVYIQVDQLGQWSPGIPTITVRKYTRGVA
jgi:hypothetical protein